jgi:LPS-assembly lipoprotein
MSSSDASQPADGTPFSRRGLLRLLGLGVSSAALAGCSGGFRPLYGSLGGGEAVEKKMAQVDIVPIPGVTGQRIRNELLFKARGGGDPLPPVYRLEVAIKESTTTTLVLRDGTSAANIYQIDARFQLVNIKAKKIMLQGQSSSRATFERFANVYSNVRAADDAQDRAAKTIAVDLKSRIAAFLATAA